MHITLSCCPVPIPVVYPSFTILTELERTLSLYPVSMSISSVSVGCLLETTYCLSSSAFLIGERKTSDSITEPSENFLASVTKGSPTYFGIKLNLPSSYSNILVLPLNEPATPSSNLGATTTSVKHSRMASAVSTSKGLL